MFFSGLHLAPIMHVRSLLNLALAPARPRAEFRFWLQQELLAESERQAAEARARQVYLLGNSVTLPARKGVLIGAAVGSVVSIAGLLALILRQRNADRQPATRAA